MAEDKSVSFACPINFLFVADFLDSCDDNHPRQNLKWTKQYYLHYFHAKAKIILLPTDISKEHACTKILSN